jgi:outer membrane lipoprotein-sorting protein|tara:strand:- start:561 stop:1127 length:567 start_codon:yes stop_codon:yes gene_type:complete
LLKKLLLFIIFFLFANNTFADIQKQIINKITGTQTLSFDFKQTIANKKEFGNCLIKYPLLMKCYYQNTKRKVVISNGKTVAVIKTKIKKIYLYPIKSTPLFFILKKEELIKLVRNNKPTKINSKIVEFKFSDKKNSNLKLFFDRSSLNFKGWETKDAYSNNVTFLINNLKTNDPILDEVFILPQEKNL